jgi:drug/metabolite transporter (DMT)-like permease
MEKMNKQKLKGLLMVLGGTITLATVPVFSKVLMRQIPPVHFTLLWMMCALSYTIILAFFKGIKGVLEKIRCNFKNIFFAGIFASLWVFLYFEGLNRIDPTVSSFLFNSRAIWGLLIGLCVLKEKYKKLEWTGMSMILLGSVLITSNAAGGAELSGMLLIVLSAFSYVLTSTFVKKFIGKTGIVPVLVARFLLPVFFMLIISLRQGGFCEYVNKDNILLLLAGSFIGPFFSFILIFNSLKYIGVGLQTICQSTAPLFTGMLAFFIMGIFPPLSQFVAGIVILAGVTLIGLQAKKTMSGPSSYTNSG